MLLDRTFHPDEANQAFTTGRLLETGAYLYDPKDYHGPTLYYAAAAIQKAAGNSSTATLDPTLLRCTPLLFAVLTLLLGISAIRKISKSCVGGIVFAALLGTAPIFLFFATDFIQEMLLACFSMMMYWAATSYLLPGEVGKERRKGRSALIFGIAAGLAFATKETCVLSFAAAALAALPFLVKWHCHRRADTESSAGLHVSSHIVLALSGFLLTSALLYSSFTDNWHGIYDAFVTAPLSYLHRAIGDAASDNAAAHVHPWWQYLKWTFLGYVIKDGDMHWTCRFSELTVSIYLLQFLPLTATAFAFFRDRLKAIPTSIRNGFLYVCAYTTILLVLYSLIPYKTPWCSLQILIGVMATFTLGYAAIGEILPCINQKTRWSRNILLCTLTLSVIFGEHIPSIRTMMRNPDSRDIPYNYAAASPQVKDMASVISEAIKGKRSPFPFIAVAIPTEDTWPLPFYLRTLNSKIGYWTQFEELEVLADIGGKPDVVVVPAEEGHRVQSIFPYLKNTKRFEMRHRVRIRVFW